MHYLTYPEAVGEHFALMWAHGEVRYGVFDRSLIESALALRTTKTPTCMHKLRHCVSAS